MIFINFKTYEHGTGAKAAELARILGECESKTGIAIIPVVQPVDIRLCIGYTKEIWVQHVDSIDYGQHTGWVLPESVLQAGASGTFLNHSEHKLGRQHIRIPVDMVDSLNSVVDAAKKLEVELGREPSSEEVAKETNLPVGLISKLYASLQEILSDESVDQYDETTFLQLSSVVAICQNLKLKTVVFAEDIVEVGRIIGLAPAYVAYEPPELIASKDTSVAKAEPQIISEVAKITQKKNIPLIVGAGVKDARDVKVSLGLGAVGVALSSAVMLAEDPKKVVMRLIEGFR